MMPNSSPVVSVRVSTNERDLLQVAAKQARTNLSDFVRRRAIEAAEMEILDFRAVTIPAKDWEKFEAWISEPPREVSALRKLASTIPIWQR